MSLPARNGGLYEVSGDTAVCVPGASSRKSVERGWGPELLLQRALSRTQGEDIRVSKRDAVQTGTNLHRQAPGTEGTRRAGKHRPRPNIPKLPSRSHLHFHHPPSPSSVA